MDNSPNEEARNIEAMYDSFQLWIKLINSIYTDEMMSVKSIWNTRGGEEETGMA